MSAGSAGLQTSGTVHEPRGGAARELGGDTYGLCNLCPAAPGQLPVRHNATLAADIRRKGLIILYGLFDDYAQVIATEHRESKNGVTDVKRLRDLTQAFRDLTDDIQTNNGPDNELLASLMELERRSEA